MIIVDFKIQNIVEKTGISFLIFNNRDIQVIIKKLIQKSYIIIKNIFIITKLFLINNFRSITLNKRLKR